MFLTSESAASGFEFEMPHRSPRLQRAGLKGEGLALTSSDSPACVPGPGMLLNVQRGLGYYLERRLASLKGIMVLHAPPPKSGAWD